MSIQSVKGVEVGDGFETARRPGSAAHDEIVRGDGTVHRLTNRAGGIEGGMSNGEPIRLRVAFKPISTVPRALRTIDTATGDAATALHQRSDTTAVVPGAVVAEAMASLVVAEALTDKFGGTPLLRCARHWAPTLIPFRRYADERCSSFRRDAGLRQTTAGRIMARSLDLPFRDSDALIEETEGVQFREIFTDDGESGFRVIEARVIQDALENFHGVLSLGGGAVLTESTRHALRGSSRGADRRGNG